MNNIIDFNIYSNHDKVFRITAWIRHFICNLRVKTQKTINESILKPNELKKAEKLLAEANELEFHLNELIDNFGPVFVRNIYFVENDTGMGCTT